MGDSSTSSPTASPLPAYRRQRAVTIAAYTWLDLVEVSVGIDLPGTVHRLSSFRDLRDAASEYVGLCNDMWPLERDQGAGGFHNAILLAQHHQELTLQEAVDQVNDVLTGCAHLAAQDVEVAVLEGGGGRCPHLGSRGPPRGAE